MKKYIICFMILMFVIILISGCTNFYNGKRPVDYGHAKWIAASPDIWFVVTDRDVNHEYLEPKGEMTVGNEVLSFTIGFNTANGGCFKIDDDHMLFAGACEFSPEKLIVKIDKDTDKVFNGEVDEIVFIRTAIDE